VVNDLWEISVMPTKNNAMQRPWFAVNRDSQIPLTFGQILNYKFSIAAAHKCTRGIIVKELF
jgi:hypothetical protein